jgi:GT2 family glycosyltransferase
MDDSLAVVICTYRRAWYAAAVVEQVIAQLAPGDELLVVDQSDDAEHAELVAHLPPHVERIRRPPGLPAARNAGLAATRSPIVLYLDDDVILTDGCLEAHRRAYADPTVGGAVGRIRERLLRPNARGPTNRVGYSGRILVNLDADRAAEVEILKGANMSLRRRALGEVGGFDEGYTGTALLEDADVSVRLRRRGWRLRFLPDAAVEHLSAPAGGVRADRSDAERWRFRNTGYFVRRTRAAPGWVAAGATFAAIAAKSAWTARDPGVAVRLAGAFVEGWVTGGGARPPPPAPPRGG